MLNVYIFKSASKGKDFCDEVKTSAAESPQENKKSVTC